MLSQGLKKGDQKPFWRYVRSQRQDNQGVSPLLKGNKLLSDPGTKARILSEQFCSVFTVDEPETANISLGGPSYPPHDPLHVTEAGVQKLLKNLNSGKASGLDEIPTPLLKELADDITPLVYEYHPSDAEPRTPAGRVEGCLPGVMCSRRAAEMIQRSIVPCH